MYNQSALGFPNYSLLSLGSTPSNWASLALEDVRDQLVRQRKKERPEDRAVRLGDCRFEFDAIGGAFVRFRGGSRFGARRPMTANAVSQLIRVISGPKSLSLLEELILDGSPQDLRMASRLISSLVGRGHSGHEVHFRIVSRRPVDWQSIAEQQYARFEGALRSRSPRSRVEQSRRERSWNEANEQHAARPAASRRVRVVTAIVSSQYRNYDDAQLLTDVLDLVKAPEEFTVMSADRSTDGFVMRVSRSKEPVALKVPVPMIELRNSEVGCGSTAVSAGIFKLTCTNGMHSWKRDAIHRWPHRIDAPPVEEGLAAALERVGVEARGAFDDYQRAQGITVAKTQAEVESWLNTALQRHHISKRFIAQVIRALEHPTTELGEGGEYLLSSIVDAITLSAQRENHSHRFELERLAGRLVHEGMAMA